MKQNLHLLIPSQCTGVTKGSQQMIENGSIFSMKIRVIRILQMASARGKVVKRHTMLTEIGSDFIDIESAFTIHID